ncbi:MAG: glycosyltransferase [Planctomycetota bacterium]
MTANFPPEASGGTEQVVWALLRELRARGVGVAVVSGSDLPASDVDASAADVVREQHDGIAVTRLRRRVDEHDQHGFVRPRLLAEVGRVLDGFAPDVVHVHSFAALGFGVAALCQERSLPMVVTCHDLWLTCARYFRVPVGGVACPDGTDREACITCIHDATLMDPARIAAGLHERDRLVREELRAARHVTAPSRTAANLVAAHAPYAGEIEVIPHGLLAAVPAPQNAIAKAVDGVVRVGTFGGLVPEKGVRELVLAGAAASAFDRGRTKLELHLSGPFHDPAFEREIVQLAQEHSVTLHCHGRYGFGDPHPARGLDLAVFPSQCQETYGLVVDEALAHGVPVLCSDGGALSERAATPGVMTVRLADLGAELAAALVELVGSPARLAALRAAIPAQLPTITRSAERHLELYRSLA